MTRAIPGARRAAENILAAAVALFMVGALIVLVPVPRGPGGPGASPSAGACPGWADLRTGIEDLLTRMAVGITPVAYMTAVGDLDVVRSHLGSPCKDEAVDWALNHLIYYGHKYVARDAGVLWAVDWERGSYSDGDYEDAWAARDVLHGVLPLPSPAP